MKHLLYIGPTVIALLLADQLLTDGREAGWERNCVFDMERRLQADAGADGLVLLGSSTSADWVDRRYLEQLLGLPAGAAVDAHINGCHQGCTYAQVRRLLRQKRHFRWALYGVNQFQLCEHPHSKRVLQHRMLMPPRDAWRLLPHYLRTEQPLTYVARYVGGAISGAYADTSVLQRRWADALFGRARAASHRWHRRAPPAPRWTGLCGYRPGEVAYKRGLTAALLDDLDRLADRTLLLMLPDENLERDEPATRRAWRAHRRLLGRLADERPHVELIDLSRDGAQTRDHFRDGVHVSPWGLILQRALFERRLAERGLAARPWQGGSARR